jgi:hypothetical protein
MLSQFRLQLTLTLALFLTINMSYFWEGEFGIAFLIIIILLFIIYFLLSIEFIRQLYISVKNKFSEKTRNFLLLLMFSCLVLILIKPKGLINFEKILDGEDKVLAQAEGAANCTTTLKLKNNEKFVYESVCFGIDRIKGEYKISNDTIYFKNSRKSFEYKFGVIDKDENIIKLYKNKSNRNYYGIPIVVLK